MTIYPDTPPDFACVICGEARPPRWQAREEADIPPVCRGCERTWGRSTFGGWQDRNRDRRIAGQIFALARVLETEAWRAKHRESPIYGRA
jgi:hypothetical protein